MRAAFTVRDCLEEATSIQVRVSIGLRFREHHTGGHAMRLQMLHGGARILGSRPDGEVTIQLVLVLQTAMQRSEFFCCGPGRVTEGVA